MARGYQYYIVEQFPKWKLGYKFETQHQESMFSEVDESPRTIVTAVGIADFEEFSKFHVLHETYQRVTGRYKNEPINGYIAQIESHIFYHPIESIVFIDAQRNYCREIVDRLKKSKVSFSVHSDEIDLIKLGDDLREKIRGGWFGDLKVADVSTIGLFGSTVGESEEWHRFEQIGKLKAIDLRLELNGMDFPAKIMSNRGVVLFETHSEALSLKLLKEIQRELDNYRIDTIGDEDDEE
ncbi:MAG: hypothetical protein JW963_15460 [Anaerolineales bacterium]|nr:hypothetical protein [Anaerolineales bacterium]